MAENDSGEWVTVAEKGSVGDGEMKAVALGVGVGGDRLRRLAG